MKYLLLAMTLLLPHYAAAGITMCTDPQTGRKVFTDKACPTQAAAEQIKVQSTITESGAATARARGNQTWDSDRDQRRTGRDYRSQEGSFATDSGSGRRYWGPAER